MPIVTGGTGHNDFYLSDYAIAAFNDQSNGDGYIGGLLLPEVPVDYQSNKYYVLDQRSFMGANGDDALRAPRTAARKIEWSVGSDSYFCDNFALANEIGVEENNNLDAVLQRDTIRTRLVVGNLRRAQEVRIANMLTSISNVGSGVALTGGNKWSDYANSNPIGDIMTGQAFIQAKTGFIANKLALDWNTAQILRIHPQFLDMFKYTAGGTVSNQELAQALGVDEILVGRGARENQLEGAAASSITTIWGNSAVLSYTPPSGNSTFELPGAGAVRFTWNNNGIYPGQFGVLRDIQNGAGSRHVDILEVGQFQDEKITAKNMLYTITGTL